MSNNRIRNAVIILILCLIGGYRAYKGGANRKGLALGQPPADLIRDAVAGGPSHRRAENAGLRLSNTNDDELRDSVAGNAIPAGRRNGPTRGDTEDNSNPPPRGGDHHGVGPLNGPNPGQQLPPPAPLSPTAPPPPFQD